MRFTLVADSSEKFATWVADVRTRGGVLDSATFAQLARPTRGGGDLTYGTLADDPFDMVAHGHMATALVAQRGALTCSADSVGPRFLLTNPSSWARAARSWLRCWPCCILITAKGWWPYLWREWITSVDHKRIGVMYMILGLVMLLRGFADAIMMRTQLALAAGHALGYLPPEHYDQIFTAHGTIMIFFVAMPFVIGLMNFALPLQLGVRDVAFPVLNSISFWLTASGVALVNLSLFVGEFARTGWLAYPPLSELAYSPGVGVDYYLWSLQLSGIGTLLSGINLTTTILKLRAPGMGYLRMPIFCWTALASNLLIVAAFPVLTATFAMLLLDRYCRLPLLHQ